MSRFAAIIPVGCLTLAAVLMGACEKDNDIVAQEQIRRSRTGCPEGCVEFRPGCEIKGNISDMGNKFFHLPGGRYYDGIVIEPEQGERWFCSEAEAVENGWRPSAQ